MTKELAEQKKKIRSYLEGDSFKEQLAKALPTHLKPDRFLRISVTAMTKTPKLWECDQASLFNALLTLSQLGLEPDGRRAHLIPYNKTCQLIIDYKGIVELIINTGEVSTIHTDVVCEKDVFLYDRGVVKKHEINFRVPRGEVYAAYAIIRFKDGTEKAEVMNCEEIEKVRNRSKAKDNGPWKTDWSEMAKKTVFRRASKWVKLSPEQRDLIEADDDYIISKQSARDVGTEMEKRLFSTEEEQTIEAEVTEFTEAFCPNKNEKIGIGECAGCQDLIGCPAHE